MHADASRRRFLHLSSLGLAAIAVGCGGCGGSQTAAPNTKPGDDAATDTNGGGVDSTASTDTGSAPDTSSTDAALDATPECIDTDDNIEGPFFKPSSPERANLLAPGQAGVKLTLTGRVLGEGCGVVLAGATLDFWQADWEPPKSAGGEDVGVYDDVKMRGHQFADKDGRYALTTVIPGHYLNGAQYRPSHIHVKVSAPGYPLLTTQLYFDGDKYNAIDPFIKPRLIMKLVDVGGGAKAATFDFVLKKA